jgi:hypothetical protein
MEPQLHEIRMKLDDLRILSDNAQKRVSDLNKVALELKLSGLVPQAAILGEVVLNRPYPPAEGGRDSGQVLQVAVLIPGGAGLLIWDSERFHELRVTQEGLEANAFWQFTGFDELESGLQGIVAMHLDDLINRFATILG